MNILQTQPPQQEACESDQFEDHRLIARVHAVGVQYEFAPPGEVESEDDRRKRQQRNQRRVTDEEKRLRDVVGDQPPPPQQVQVIWRIMRTRPYVHLRWSR